MQSEITIFLNSLSEGDLGFRFQARSSATLLSTCFGLQLIQLADLSDAFETDSICSRICGYQEENGVFRDPIFRASDLHGSHSSEYLEWQFSFFALVSLDWIGIRPTHPVSFVDEYVQSWARLENWLVSRKWDNFWYCSNEIMFLLYFLTYRSERCGDQDAAQRIQDTLDWLDQHQSSVTGFWGEGVEKTPETGMYGAAHIFLFYDYFQRKIHHARQAVQHTLALQHPFGLFGNIHGGACEDYDGVDVLVRLRPFVENQAAVDQALQNVYHRLQCGKGLHALSYSLSHHSLRGTISRMILWQRKQDHYNYSGWTRMRSNRFQPDVWSVFFRMMTLALIEQVLDVPETIAWNFYSLPGWGYAGPSAEKG